MKKVIAIALSFIMLLSFAACGAKSVVGKWVFGGVSFNFKDDTNVSISANGALNYDGTYVIEGDKIIVTAKGMLGDVTEEFTYSLKGDTLTLTGDVTLMGGVDTTVEFKKQK